MKKLLILALGLLPMLPLSGQNRVVKIARITETTTPPTVTFRVYWNAAPDNNRHRDSVWVFVDYQTVNNSGPVGDWTAATLTNINVSPPGTLSDVRNGRGFYLKGTQTSDFSSTVTVALSGVVPANTKFNWCAYASDYPPNATENNGYYDLHGSPPFTINGNITETSKTYTGGCIEQLTDATGCPGEVPMLPEVLDFTASTAAVCPGGSVTLTASAKSVTTEFSFDGGTVWIPATPAGTATGATTSVAPTGTTDYTVLVRSLAGCTKSSTVTHTVTVNPLPTPSFTNAPSTLCAGSSVTVVATGGGSYCFTHTCSNCVHNPYSTGNDLSTEVDCDMNNTSCSFSSSRSYTLTMPDAGSVTVSVTVKNSSGCTATIDTTITSVRPTLTLLSAATTTQQTIELGVPITPIEYAVANATATVAGLPPGTTYTYTSGTPATLTISGTPTATSDFTYTITLSGICPSAVPLEQRQGVITVLCPLPVYPDGGTFENFVPGAETRYTLTDARDNKKYNVVKIGTKWVMAQNLNYQNGLTWQANANMPSTGIEHNPDLIGHFWCPGGDGGSTSTLASCDVWGALYSWETAMMVDGKWSDDNRNSTAWADVSYSFSTSSGNTNNGGKGAGSHGICPANWHVPTDAEWGDILNEMETGTKDHNTGTGWRGTDAGIRGKSDCTCASGIIGSRCVDDVKTNWYNYPYTLGTDSYGFRVLPAGYRYYDGSIFDDRSYFAWFWSSSACRSGAVWYRNFVFANATVEREIAYPSSGFSVRCIHD